MYRINVVKVTRVTFKSATWGRKESERLDEQLAARHPNSSTVDWSAGWLLSLYEVGIYLILLHAEIPRQLEGV